jgi:hypothetical protein
VPFPMWHALPENGGGALLHANCKQTGLQKKVGVGAHPACLERGRHPTEAEERHALPESGEALTQANSKETSLQEKAGVAPPPPRVLREGKASNSD